MLFTPNDFSSSSVCAISGVAHSQPNVWQETVTPLTKEGLALSAAGRDGTRRRTRTSNRNLSGTRRNERIFGQIIKEKCIEANRSIAIRACPGTERGHSNCGV